MSRTCVVFVALGLVATAPWAESGGGPEDAKPAKRAKGKITIGKDTTYVTEPRDKHGYIDYASALNERLRKGVTPDNNANVLLWKAFGPRPEGATMPPKFFKWLGIDEPPEKGKYFIGQFQFMKKNLDVDPKRDVQDLQKDFDAAQERPWKLAKYPIVAGWLTANEKTVALVAQATKRSHYFSPLVSKDTDKGPSGLLSALLPAVQKCRELAYLLQIRVMLHLGEGRYDDAWQDLLTCHRLARHLARGGTLIEGLVGIAIEAIASHTDQVFLNHAKMDAKKLKECLRDLQALPPMPSVADKIDLAERFVFLDIVTLLDRHGGKQMQDLANAAAIFGAAAFQVPEEVAARVLDGIDWDPALRNGNRWYDRLAAAMRLKDRNAREKQLDQIGDEIKKLRKELEESGLPKILKGDKLAPEVRGKLVGDGLICLILPAVRKVQMASDRAEQTQRNLHVAFALAAYQREHGRYPMKLDELAPKYLAQVPGDLFSGKALIYRPSEKACLVYSVGANGVDEGGRYYDDAPPGDDPRVLLTLPEPKK